MSLKITDHMDDSPPAVRTTGKMAADLGVPKHRVEYVIRSRGIRESARAGQFRLYGRDAFRAVADALDAIDARRGQGVGSD